MSTEALPSLSQSQLFIVVFSKAVQQLVSCCIEVISVGVLIGLLGKGLLPDHADRTNGLFVDACTPVIPRHLLLALLASYGVVELLSEADRRATLIVTWPLGEVASISIIGLPRRQPLINGLIIVRAKHQRLVHIHVRRIPSFLAFVLQMVEQVGYLRRLHILVLHGIVELFVLLVLFVQLIELLVRLFEELYCSQSAVLFILLGDVLGNLPFHVGEVSNYLLELGERLQYLFLQYLDGVSRHLLEAGEPFVAIRVPNDHLHFLEIPFDYWEQEVDPVEIPLALRVLRVKSPRYEVVAVR